MFCPRCNKLLPDNANVCDNCGVAIEPVAYMAPVYEDPRTKPLTVGNYLLMTLIMIVPVVNIVMLLVWAFGDENLNRKNWARAQLIWMLIGIVLGIILAIAFVGIAMNMVNMYSDFLP